MIIMVTGVPGSGKTLYSIGLLRKWLSEGRQVFADIDGLRVHGVMPAPEDWREAPEGSVVIYDEAQKRFGSQGMRGGRSERSDIAALEEHRHTGHDLLLITQHASLIHSHVRRLVGRHHHVFRLFGSPAAKIFTQERAMDTDSLGELRSADCQTWQFPRKDYSAYKSATVHTHKMRLPRFAVMGLGLMALLAAASAFLFSRSTILTNAVAADDVEVTEGSSARRRDPFAPNALPPIIDAQQSPVLIKGCISSETRCVCYGFDRAPIALENTVCRAYAENASLWMVLGGADGAQRRAPSAPTRNTNR
jgi:zona occludens toxin (predicted ATPase)